MKDVYQLPIGWFRKDQVSKSCDEDSSYSYHVIGGKRLLKEPMQVKQFHICSYFLAVNFVIFYLSIRYVYPFIIDKSSSVA